MRTAETSIADGRAANHANSLCYALSQAACPIALSVGDLAAAERYVEMLLDQPCRWFQGYRKAVIRESGEALQPAAPSSCCSRAPSDEKI